MADGTAFHRPRGQVRPAEGSEASQFSESKMLDFEIELGIVIGQGNQLGTPIKVADAQDHVFGYCMLNDWSTRDI